MHRFSGRLPKDLDVSIVDAMPAQQPVPTHKESGAPIDLSDASASAAHLRCRLPSGAMLRRALDTPYVPAACGPWPVRHAIADWLTACERPTLAEDVVVAASTSEAFSWLIKWWCAPGDAIAHMVPGYPLLSHLAEAEGVRAMPVPSAWDGVRWALDVDALKTCLQKGARAVVLTSPNNPTGAALSETEARQVAEVCNAHGALCIVDEVFGPYLLGARWPSSPLAHAERLVSLGGLSKAALLPQAKLSWLHLCGTAEFREDARVHLTWLGDLYLSVSAVAAQVAQSVLPQAARFQARLRKRLRGNARWLSWSLPREGVGELLPVEGGFVAPVRLAQDVAQAWQITAGGAGLKRLADSAMVTWEPAMLFDLPSDLHLVVSLLLPPARLKAGWRRVFEQVAARRNAGLCFCSKDA